jgi:hypothetical protein
MKEEENGGRRRLWRSKLNRRKAGDLELEESWLLASSLGFKSWLSFALTSTQTSTGQNKSRPQLSQTLTNWVCLHFSLFAASTFGTASILFSSLLSSSSPSTLQALQSYSPLTSIYHYLVSFLYYSGLLFPPPSCSSVSSGLAWSGVDVFPLARLLLPPHHDHHNHNHHEHDHDHHPSLLLLSLLKPNCSLSPA